MNELLLGTIAVLLFILWRVWKESRQTIAVIKGDLQRTEQRVNARENQLGTESRRNADLMKRIQGLNVTVDKLDARRTRTDKLKAELLTAEQQRDTANGLRDIAQLAHDNAREKAARLERMHASQQAHSERDLELIARLKRQINEMVAAYESDIQHLDNALNNYRQNGDALRALEDVSELIHKPSMSAETHGQ